MSHKHNTKHNRSKSRYPKRLRDRGATSSSVRMRTMSRGGSMRFLGLSEAAYAAHCKALQDRLGSAKTKGQKRG